MRRKFAERLFYWIGRRLGKLPTVQDAIGLDDSDSVAQCLRVESRGRAYDLFIVVIGADKRELIHPLSGRLLTTLHCRRRRTIGQCKRRPAT